MLPHHPVKAEGSESMALMARSVVSKAARATSHGLTIWIRLSRKKRHRMETQLPKISERVSK
jgi:hypothetical protein